MKINANSCDLIGPLTNKLSSTECEIISEDSHPVNVSLNKFNSLVENGVPAAAHSHNHTDIVHFVGSGNMIVFQICHLPFFIDKYSQ